MNRDAAARLRALRGLLEGGELSSQEELRKKLVKLNFAVTQSTISRDLRKLGAIRTTDREGQTVYRLPDEAVPSIPGRLADLVRSIATNGSLIVIHTTAGSASLIARHLDQESPAGILGTIAGDDTIFAAPAKTSTKEVNATILAIQRSISRQSQRD